MKLVHDLIHLVMRYTIFIKKGNLIQEYGKEIKTFPDNTIKFKNVYFNWRNSNDNFWTRYNIFSIYAEDSVAMTSANY